MILTPKEDLIQRTTTEQLAEYAQNFSDKIPKYLLEIKEELEGLKQVILQFDISPGKNLELKIAAKPTNISFNATLKQEIGNLVKTVPVLDVKNGVVQFQIYFPVPN